MAGSTRLELATSCVTGRRSNQLNYDPVTFSTLPLCCGTCSSSKVIQSLGGTGFEPVTLCV